MDTLIITKGLNDCNNVNVIVDTLVDILIVTECLNDCNNDDVIIDTLIISN